MQSIQKVSPAHLCVRVSRVVLVCFLPLAAFAQQLPTQTQPQLLTQTQPKLPMQVPCALTTPGRCAAQLAKDQRNIFTSPFRLHKKDLVWITPLAAATGTAFAFDKMAMQGVSTDPSRINAFNRASNITGIYAPVAFAGTALLGGIVRHDEHLRETGMLAMTAMIDTQLLNTFVKFAADRARPGDTVGAAHSGTFWPNGGHSSSFDSFPSGHTANAFAVAHVIADEYPGWKVKLAVYSLAAATAFERVQARQHFPSDVLVGGALGYLVGGYVFNHHSSRSKTHIAFAPMIGHGGGGLSVQISPGQK